MLHADLYEKTVSLESYLSSNDCRACGFHSRAEFLDRLQAGDINSEGCQMPKERFLALLWAVRPQEILPPIEVLQLPNPGPVGLYPLNQPTKDSPVLVSGNSELTIEVLSAVFSTTISPFWYLVVDTNGHTVDMALVYKIFSVESIEKAFKQADLSSKAKDATVYLPGLAEHFSADLKKRIQHIVAPGPVCAAELPIFFGEKDWKVITDNSSKS